jgi:amino acid adenylation domain-containing protein
VAVSDGADELTYRELDGRSAALARLLRRRGVGPEVPVGLLVERGPDLVVAILAVLRAGGAYVPLDPEWPAERLAQVAADSGFRLLLADRRTASPAAEVAAGAGVEVVAVDDDPPAAELAAEAADGADLPAVAPGQLAYVIYTSGSTGRPKGVEVTHANVVRLLTATAAFAFGERDVWPLFHSAAFDVSVWELWGALAHGGRLVIVPRRATRAPGELLDLMAREGVTVLGQTPSAFAALDAEDARRGGRDRLALRWVIFAGEALEPAALAGWFARRGGGRPRLVNMYGITETTVHVTWRRMAAGAEGGRSPIGVPMPDLSASVVDRRGEPVPVGVAGELLVGGPGVARGYRGRPGLTAERFVPDPFAAPGEAGRRVYRSGDRVRWRATGELDYLGRLDQQVQVRGFRVEPGEVEAALLALPEVAAAAVVPRDDLPAGFGLVAYFVAAAGEAPAAPDELKAALRRRLPEYMVPAWLVPLAELPRTPNGKLDRRALASLAPPGGERPALGRPYEEPQGPLEEVLAAAWAEALGVDRVGRRDSFFDLGGHSLLATRMVAWVREALGAEVPLGELFAEPTVAGLATGLRTGDDGGAAAERAAELLLEIGAMSDAEVAGLAAAGGGAAAGRPGSP